MGQRIREIPDARRLPCVRYVRLMAAQDPTDPQTLQALEEEIAGKLTVAGRGGGYLYHADHSTLKNVSLDQYWRVIELVRRYGSYG